MNFLHTNLCLRPRACRYREGTVCDMFFETELSDKLNSELESAGISVSEALIAKTLAAVQAARTTEEKEVPDSEWTEAREENVEKLIELAQARKGRIKGAGPVLFRLATVMAACFVLVVGAFALRFSTMRMGKENAAPMATAENESARNGVKYAADSDSIAAGEDFKYFSESVESKSEEEESAVASINPAQVPMDAIAPTSESNPADDADAVMAEAETGYEEVERNAQEKAASLMVRLEQAESVEKERTAQGNTVYRFVMQDDAETYKYYLVHENGEVEFAMKTEDGEIISEIMYYNDADSKEFRRIVLVLMKKHGYEFDAE